MAKGFPVKVNIPITVPANAAYDFLQLPDVPDNESWSLCQIDVNGTDGVTVADFTINDNPVGLYVGGGFGNFNAISTYGSPLQLVGKNMGVHVTNGSDQAKSVTLLLYVFKQQLYATRQG